MRAVVVGSLNMDLVLGVPELPSRGQTLLSRSRDRSPGGKGANQASALGRLGAGMEMVGAVGDDADGAELVIALAAAGLSTRHVSKRAQEHTGWWSSASPPRATTRSWSPPGQRHAAPRRCRGRRPGFAGAGLLLLQLEIPPETVLAAAAAGRQAGALVILNAAPVRDMAAGLLGQADVLVVNAGEAAALAGGDDPEVAAARLRDQGPGVVVVTRGGEGCLVADDHGMSTLPADPVAVVETTGAATASPRPWGSGWPRVMTPGRRPGSPWPRPPSP